MLDWPLFLQVLAMVALGIAVLVGVLLGLGVAVYWLLDWVTRR